MSLFGLLLSACVPNPPDVPVCERLTQRLAKDPKTDHLILTPSPTCMEKIGEPECGHCTYIVSGKEVYIGEKKFLGKKPWSQIQRESVLVPAKESYAPLARYIIDSCEKMNCNDDVQRFRVKVETLGVTNQGP